jgi:hypothetical protein
MKCEACNYGELIEGVGPEHDGNIKCKLTNEEHAPFFDCNCEHTRIRRDKEARLLNDKKAAEEALAALKATIIKPHPDIEYVYSVLHQIREEVESNKLEELIRYLEAFL